LIDDLMFCVVRVMSIIQTAFAIFTQPMFIFIQSLSGKNYSGGGAGGGYGAAVNEIAEVRGCHTVLFLECRKRGQDGYLWLGRTTHANEFSSDEGGGATNEQKKHLMIAGGPSVKFHITNIHTMDELKMTGNCMKGSRPILSFDTAFDTVDHLKLVKHLLVDVFGTPRGHPKSKPFVDRVMGFYYADGKVRCCLLFILAVEKDHIYVCVSMIIKERAYIRDSKSVETKRIYIVLRLRWNDTTQSYISINTSFFIHVLQCLSHTTT
jgi:hypothetical protein